MWLTWFGHHSYRIEFSGKALYIDPYAGDPSWYDKKASLILVTKADFDHFSRARVDHVYTDGTHIFGPREVASEMYGVRPFLPGEFLVFEDNTRVQATAAVIRRRNLTSQSLGWLLTIEGKTLYFTGDTDATDDVLKVKADIVIIPVGGTYTMKAKDAAKAVSVIKPKLAIPGHYGRTAGTHDDAELFKELVENARETQVLILEAGVPVNL